MKNRKEDGRSDRRKQMKIGWNERRKELIKSFS